MFAPTDDFLAQACAQTLIDLPAKTAETAVCDAMDQIFSLADGVWRSRCSSMDYLRTAPPLACRAGCGWCCHQTVGITVPEAVRIAVALRDLPADLTAAVIELDRKTRGMTPAQRVQSQTACAFLGVDGNCRIYHVRPLRCRGLYSTDAKFCEQSCCDPDGMQEKLARGLLQPVFLSLPQGIYDGALSGVLMAVKKRRWALVSLELSAAVAALTADPALIRKWLAGGKPAANLSLTA